MTRQGFRRASGALLAGITIIALPIFAQAPAAYPTKPIRLIVP